MYRHNDRAIAFFLFVQLRATSIIECIPARELTIDFNDVYHRVEKERDRGRKREERARRV